MKPASSGYKSIYGFKDNHIRLQHFEGKQDQILIEYGSSYYQTALKIKSVYPNGKLDHRILVKNLKKGDWLRNERNQKVYQIKGEDQEIAKEYKIYIIDKD